jgi:hypothetical protein
MLAAQPRQPAMFCQSVFAALHNTILGHEDVMSSIVCASQQLFPRHADAYQSQKTGAGSILCVEA